MELKFKVGDKVRIKKNPPAFAWNPDGDMDYLKGSIQKIHAIRSGSYGVYDSKRRYTWLIGDEDIEGLVTEEPKQKAEFKVGDTIIFVRKATGKFAPYNDYFTIGNKYKVNKLHSSDAIDVATGRPSGISLWMPSSCFEIVVEPKYPIITTHMGEKVVFNPPYTIVTCNLTSGAYKGQKLIGKAKCHPTDTYDKWTGYVIAHERMTKATPCTK